MFLSKRYFQSGICTTKHIESFKIVQGISIKLLIGIFILLGVGLLFAALIVILEFSFNKIALHVQRSVSFIRPLKQKYHGSNQVINSLQKHSKLKFGSTYDCNVVGIENNGIFIQLPTVSTVNKVFVSMEDIYNTASPVIKYF